MVWCLWVFVRVYGWVFIDLTVISCCIVLLLCFTCFDFVFIYAGWFFVVLYLFVCYCVWLIVLFGSLTVCWFCLYFMFVPWLVCLVVLVWLFLVSLGLLFIRWFAIWLRILTLVWCGWMVVFGYCLFAGLSIWVVLGISLAFGFILVGCLCDLLWLLVCDC